MVLRTSRYGFFCDTHTATTSVAAVLLVTSGSQQPQRLLCDHSDQEQLLPVSEQFSQGQILFGLTFDSERFSAVLICRARVCLLPRFQVCLNLLSMQSVG